MRTLSDTVACGGHEPIIFPEARARAFREDPGSDARAKCDFFRRSVTMVGNFAHAVILSRAQDRKMKKSILETEAAAETGRRKPSRSGHPELHHALALY